jgi:hypothetical protein
MWCQLSILCGVVCVEGEEVYTYARVGYTYAYVVRVVFLINVVLFVALVCVWCACFAVRAPID